MGHFRKSGKPYLKRLSSGSSKEDATFPPKCQNKNIFSTKSLPNIITSCLLCPQSSFPKEILGSYLTRT